MPDDGAPLIRFGCFLTLLLMIGLIWASVAEIPMYEQPPIIYAKIVHFVGVSWANAGVAILVLFFIIATIAGAGNKR